ncbi:PLC-like phosphodiesterase [Cantharellus anzutake]|uniref:PLC-like phosphodiesterase n=1 Tax=Cantharellus anzutake TaxID=1750568 RepID=UPI001905978A|nr:PLC-like phosphodiesterase [Cantharellus anzutake]KAF8342250.1 PLC-like phosphodiesterase [Cantharellus anzutake]
MGQGGWIDIVNGTTYDWTRGYVHSYQMSAWDFPSVIKAGTSASVYIEFREKLGDKWEDDGGEVEFVIQSTQSPRFQIQAGGKGGYTLQAWFSNFWTQNNPSGSTIRLGWKHNGHVNFVLSGLSGNFSSTNPPSAWMQANRDTLGSRTLKQICIPGSHDAGMSVMNGGTAFATPGNSLTQSFGIGAQLAAGSRYFDIRPVISGGHFKTGHYSYVGSVLQTIGANGQYISDIINEINTFTSQNAELIIIKFSHTFNTDVGRTYPSFTQAEWERLFNDLLSIHNRYITSAANLTTDLTLNDFICPAGGPVPAVLIIADVESDWITDKYNNQGIYPLSSINLYDSYANSDSPDATISDQLQKMRDNSSQYFLLSWTLTLQAADIISGRATIKSLAETMNPLLYSRLTGNVTNSVYPSIIYVDYIDSNVAPLAMAINTRITSLLQVGSLVSKITSKL